MQYQVCCQQREGKGRNHGRNLLLYSKLWVGLPINQVKRRMIHNFDALKFMWKNSFVSAGAVLYRIYLVVIVLTFSPCYCQRFGLRFQVNADPIGQKLAAVIILPLYWSDSGDNMIPGSSIADPDSQGSVTY